ncbi:hypothetical protein FRB95_006793 [Tulasnella sp. JGI-2019a]|nr:hypothetical protein FRB95_006793 [Tulasnella sp. JGI-2019a]
MTHTYSNALLPVMQRLQDMPLGTPLPQVQVHVIVTNNSIPSSTTGGKGGSTVTVTTLAALTSAVTGDTATILVSGTITGNVVVEIGSNKSVIGKAGACESLRNLNTSRRSAAAYAL